MTYQERVPSQAAEGLGTWSPELLRGLQSACLYRRLIFLWFTGEAMVPHQPLAKEVEEGLQYHLISGEVRELQPHTETVSSQERAVPAPVHQPSALCCLQAVGSQQGLFTPGLCTQSTCEGLSCVLAYLVLQGVIGCFVFVSCLLALFDVVPPLRMTETICHSDGTCALALA